MGPLIATIDDAEKIRDGGSWYITVTDTNGRTYTLFSKIDNQVLNSGQWVTTYLKPILTNVLLDNCVEIEWHHAFKMLDDGKINFDNEIRLEWFNEAKKIFQSSGEVPDGNQNNDTIQK